MSEPTNSNTPVLSGCEGIFYMIPQDAGVAAPIEEMEYKSMGNTM